VFLILSLLLFDVPALDMLLLLSPPHVYLVTYARNRSVNKDEI
jgi:hypothetical protein